MALDGRSVLFCSESSRKTPDWVFLGQRVSEDIFEEKYGEIFLKTTVILQKHMRHRAGVCGKIVSRASGRLPSAGGVC